MAELPLLPGQTHLCLDRRCALRQAVSRFGEGPVGAFQLQKAAAFQVVVGPDLARHDVHGEEMGVHSRVIVVQDVAVGVLVKHRAVRRKSPDLGQGHNFRGDPRVRVDGCQAHLAILRQVPPQAHDLPGGNAVFDFRKSLFGAKHHLRIREDRSVHGVQPNEPGDPGSTKREEVVPAAVAVKTGRPGDHRFHIGHVQDGIDLGRERLDLDQLGGPAIGFPVAEGLAVHLPEVDVDAVGWVALQAEEAVLLHVVVHAVDIARQGGGCTQFVAFHVVVVPRQGSTAKRRAHEDVLARHIVKRAASQSERFSESQGVVFRPFSRHHVEAGQQQAFGEGVEHILLQPINALGKAHGRDEKREEEKSGHGGKVGSGRIPTAKSDKGTTDWPLKG